MITDVTSFENHLTLGGALIIVLLYLVLYLIARRMK